MSAAQRMAMGQRLNQLVQMGIVQDLAEAALFAGLLSGGQLALGGDPQDVAVAAATGALGSMATRPVAAAAGRAIGRRMDRAGVEGNAFYHRAMAAHPGTRQDIVRRARSEAGLTNAGMDAIAQNTFNRVYADGRRGGMEGDMGYLGRMYGDNMVQALIQGVAPSLIPLAQDSSESTTPLSS